MPKKLKRAWSRTNAVDCESGSIWDEERSIGPNFKWHANYIEIEHITDEPNPLNSSSADSAYIWGNLQVEVDDIVRLGRSYRTDGYYDNLLPVLWIMSVVTPRKSEIGLDTSPYDN